MEKARRIRLGSLRRKSREHEVSVRSAASSSKPWIRPNTTSSHRIAKTGRLATAAETGGCSRRRPGPRNAV